MGHEHHQSGRICRMRLESCWIRSTLRTLASHAGAESHGDRSIPPQFGRRRERESAAGAFTAKAATASRARPPKVTVETQTSFDDSSSEHSPASGNRGARPARTLLRHRLDAGAAWLQYQGGRPHRHRGPESNRRLLPDRAGPTQDRCANLLRRALQEKLG